jgi:transposase
MVTATYCGIDWAEGHHDIALINDDGALVAKRRIAESVDGFAELTAMLAAAGDSAHEPILVAMETPHGLLVAALRAAGRPVYAINPLAVAVPGTDLCVGQETGQTARIKMTWDW